MEWVQGGVIHRYDDPGPGEATLACRPWGSELKVRVDFGGLVFYAQTRLWAPDRICVSWHDDSYAYRSAWVPPRIVRIVTEQEYLEAEASRFRGAGPDRGRLPLHRGRASAGVR